MMESHLLIGESDFPALLLIYIHQSYQRTYLRLRLISITLDLLQSLIIV